MVRAIQKLKMDKAMLFCRTKVDCDNLENHLNKIGGGEWGMGGFDGFSRCILKVFLGEVGMFFRDFERFFEVILFVV